MIRQIALLFYFFAVSGQNLSEMPLKTFRFTTIILSLAFPPSNRDGIELQTNRSKARPNRLIRKKHAENQSYFFTIDFLIIFDYLDLIPVASRLFQNGVVVVQ